MSLSGRRRQSAADKNRARAARRNAARQASPRPCEMPTCRNLTTRPLGYCDSCWTKGDR